ncbi:hypothetical protein [Nocardioides sp.]|uniref:hypothetical protein n=1 Tax=Nocardioides sp. TaxID=35761 RepID=UPI002733E73C|nr:hypothetical protein [Nocardioides sp.]MDP3891003.1 hypothetical protein [Nocardioides sp.]
MSTPPAPNPSTAPATIPATWAALLDDAATFPPGDAPLGEALAAHAEHRRASYAALVGSFVARDTDLPQVIAAGVPLSVIATSGAGAIARPMALCARKGVEVAGLEIALRDLDDLPGNARRVAAAVDRARLEGDLGEDVPAYVELPQAEPTAGWLQAADVVADNDLRLKFRTGGVEEHLHPSSAMLASWIEAALDRETPFKCTAGLHHAVRHRDPGTGFWQHGFLNVLLATRQSFDGEGIDAVTGTLEEQDASILVDRFGELGEDTMARTRRWFTSLGTCSITEPLDDLVALGLVEL